MNEKYLLKKCLDGTLPRSVLLRAKHPYRAPVSNALLGEDERLIEKHLNKSSLRQTGFFDSKKVGYLLNKVRKSKHVSEVDNMAFAGILSTQIIHDQFVDSFKIASAEPIRPDLLFDKRLSS
jgi:asparagine synthase (glutamine-hydrolysing)